MGLVETNQEFTLKTSKRGASGIIKLTQKPMSSKNGTVDGKMVGFEKFSADVVWRESPSR